MKYIKLFLLVALAACVETEVEGPLPETFMISNDIRDIIFREGESYVLEAQYYNDSGIAVDVPILWESLDPEILSFNGDTATAHLSGIVAITAEAEGLSDDAIIEVFAPDDIVSTVTERSGMMQGVSGYNISGDHTLSINEDGDLIFTVENYTPDGPGPYFYLSNSSTSVSMAINLGAASSSGNYTINVSDINPNIGINTFDYVIIWCEPFGVRLGFGPLN